MENWAPEQNALTEIITTLQAAATPSTQAQQESYQRIELFKQNSQFCQYLVHILAHLPTQQVGVETRQVAGLLLRSTIKEQYGQFPLEVKKHIQKNVVPVLADPNANIRNAVGSVITAIISQCSIEDWPDLIPMIYHLLESTELTAIAGGFNALVKICEDSSDKLVDAPSHPLEQLIPKLLQYFQHPEPSFRRDALKCINNVMIVMPAALVRNMDLFLQGISILTADKSNDVRKLVCQSIVILTEVGIQYLIPHMESIINFIISANEDPDESVALEACEFWASYCEQPYFTDLRPMLEAFLPKVIPMLLRKMVYSEEDIIMFEAEEQQQNESVPDRPEDIKPIFHKGKGAGGDDDDADDDDDDEIGEWNLRKCSAAALDVMSNNFGDDILPILLPQLQERLVDQSHWSIRESGILALGAIAEGCASGITPHLPQLFPYLIQLMNDPAPLIRSIACWSLSRYAVWVVSDPSHLDPFFKPLMESMLKRLLDHNKKVQEAACSAFCALEEEAQMFLAPYLKPILQTLTYAFSKYQAKNLLILYDAVGTLADSVGELLNQPELVGILMPPLIAKWNALPDDNRELFPLLECLTSVAQALGVGFQDFSSPVFQRCLRLIENGLMSGAMYEQNPTEFEMPDPEFIVCSLDLISGIVEGAQDRVSALIANTNFLSLLMECVNDRTPDVRQSAFALVGDLAKAHIDTLKPGVAQLMGVLVQNLDPTHQSVCNNASWAIGEIAIKIGADIEPYIAQCMMRLIPMMNTTKLSRSLQENCAITIGRIAYVCPNALAPMLNEFLQRWCLALRDVRDASDREHCFFGLCNMVVANPAGATHHFMFICGAIASWDGETYIPPAELAATFSQILNGFKQNLGDQWPTYFQSFPASLRQTLISRYNL